MSIFSFRLSWRFLRRNATRWVLTVVALGSGVALVCAIELTSGAAFEAFAEIVDTMAGRAALQITAGDGEPFPEDVSTVAGAVPGVEIAVPVVSAAAFTTDGSGEQLSIYGVDITNDAAVRVYEPAGTDGTAVDDPLVFLSRPDSVIVTAEFAARRSLTVDDRLDLDTPSGRRRFTVRGLLAADGVARVQGGTFAVMDVAAAEAAFTRPGLVNRVDVVVRRDADVERVAAALRATLPPALAVETPAQRKVDLNRVMQSSRTLLRAVGLLGLVAAFLIAFSRLTTAFEARTMEIAILRAVGMRTREVWLELAKESLLLGAAGVALGIPLGVGIARVVLPLIATATTLSAKLVNTQATLALRPGSLALAAILGIATAALAAALPARRAARLLVAEVLRRRGTELPEASRGIPGAVRLLVVVAAVVTIALHGATGAVSYGLAASVLVVTVAALSARSLLLALARPMSATLKLAGPCGELARGSLLRNPRRSALAIATLAVGLGTVLWLGVIARSFEQSVLDVMPGVLRADLAVSSAHIGAGFVEAPVDETLLADLIRVPGVGAVVGEQAIDWHYRDGPIAINAFDAPYFTDPTFGRWPLVGRWRSDAWDGVAHGDAVIISDNFARNLHVGVDDRIMLDTPAGPLEVRVAGITPDFLSPRGTIEMSRALYARQWNDRHVVRALVKVSAGRDPGDVRTAIASGLGTRYGLKILSVGALVDWFAGQVRRAFRAIYVLAGLVLGVVLVGVGDALVAGILERTRELGIVRAVGASRKDLGLAILVEALALGAVGLGLATATGLGLGTLWVYWTFPALLGWTVTLSIPGATLAGVALASVGICAAAAWLPARRVARLDPIVALRAE
jgi:putative ABC transport system permease protein